MDEWMSGIEIEDLGLDEKNREMVEILGIEKYLEFVKTFGGSRLYINMYDEIIKNVRDRKIRKEYTRYNVRRLAHKYGLTEERIKQIVKGMGIENQMSIFD